MRLIDLTTALFFLLFFIGMTINHNQNIKKKKIETMKEISRQINNVKNLR